MLFNIIFVTFIIQINLVVSDNLWINLISQEITKSVKPYQVTIFIDYKKLFNLPQYNALIKTFQYQPNTIIDYEHMVMSENS